MYGKKKNNKKVKKDLSALQLVQVKPPENRQPKGNGTYLDLSKNGLHSFPDLFLANSQLVLLYLEGNFLTELPDEIFICFPNLKWLDIRNNSISYIPDTIKFHLRLETFLLQGNCIRYLPPELGTVSNLKTLQIIPNPLEYPSEDILSQGTEEIKEFLHEEFKKHCPAYVEYLANIKSQEEHLRKNSEILKIQEPTSAEKIYKELVKMPKVFDVERNRSDYMKRLGEISFDISPPMKVQKYFNPVQNFPFDAMGILSVLMEVNRKPQCKRRGRKDRGNLNLGEVQIECGQIRMKLEETKNLGRRMSNVNSKIIEKMLQQLLQDLRNAKLADRNYMSEKILTLRRNIETQQKFKQDYPIKSYLGFANSKFKGTVNPFGTYDEYGKMMTKSDLTKMKTLSYKALNQKVIKRLQPKKIDFNNEMLALLDALHKITLKISDDEEVTPHMKQRSLVQDMTKISVLQRSLAALKIQNNNHLSAS